MNSDSQRISYLDGWRGVAILLVLEGHFLNALPLETGRLGVDVFFCLSGFLMSGILFEQRQELKKFYKRRISRILPAFFAFVLAIHAFAHFKGLRFSTGEFAATMFFLRTYLPDQPGIWGTAVPIGHLWSLNVEEHAYVLMSFLILISGIRGREGFVLIALGVCAILIGLHYSRIGVSAPHWGVLGTEAAASHLMISAGYRLFSDRFRPYVPGWLPLLSMSIAIFCYSKAAPWWSQMVIAPFLLALTVNHLSESASWFRSALSFRPLVLFGAWSFSIYLWQQPFYSFRSAIPGGNIVALAFAMTCALLSFYCIERMCRTWLNQRW